MSTYPVLSARVIGQAEKTMNAILDRLLAGTGLTEPQWVEEQYILDLERQAFIALCHEPKSIERMWAMLKTGKPLRN